MDPSQANSHSIMPGGCIPPPHPDPYHPWPHSGHPGHQGHPFPHGPGGVIGPHPHPHPFDPSHPIHPIDPVISGPTHIVHHGTVTDGVTPHVTPCNPGSIMMK